ncbi:MAG: helix-turn-helix domain-containing protein [Solirubrobacterales bacterium]
MSHPTRRQILRAFVDESLGSASTGELAEKLGQPAARVGYHLKTLARCEVLRLSEEGDRDAAEEARLTWSLGTERDWLRLVLDVWVKSTR